MAQVAKKAAFPVRMAKGLSNLYTRANKYYVAKMPIVIKYASVELKPPSMSDLPQLKNEIRSLIAKKKDWQELTPAIILMNSILVWEVFCWFCVGEIIGKRHIRGYDAGYSAYVRDGAGNIDPVILPDTWVFPELPRKTAKALE